MSIGTGKSQLDRAAAASGAIHLHTTIPASRVLILGSVPLQLIPPSPGKLIVLSTIAVYSLINGTTPYTLGAVTNANLLYEEGFSPIGVNDPAATSVTAAGFFDTLGSGSWLSAPGPSGGVSFGPTGGFPEGKGIVLSTFDVFGNGTDMTVGDIDLIVDFFYNLINVSS